MNTIVSSLDSSILAQRLVELAGEERRVQVDFLLHLDEFDRRRAYLEVGFGSLWDYCLHALHLREGAAGRRIGAMRVLRRYPRLEGALRDGRLCLSTLALLGQVLTEENADELVARAAFRTKAEVDHLVASVQPRRAPKDGVRKLGEEKCHGIPPHLGPLPREREKASQPNDVAEALTLAAAEPGSAAPPAPTAVEPPARTRTAEVRAVSEDHWSLRLTIDSECKEELETLKALLSHKVPGGDLGAVLREAIRCGIEKHGKRKGAVEPAQRRAPKSEPSPDPHAISAEVRRQVWNRDGGCCSWKAVDGRRCGSRWQLEVDHILPPSRGGTSAADNLRLLCRSHNLLHADEVYGRGFMARFRRAEPAIAGDSSWKEKIRDATGAGASAASAIT